ncbi:MAG: pilus assembly protein PilM [candidate division KSB1 bacterium]|nr:pilus assembly protein PilM [candidate division KSB1 bacterium]
MNLHQAEESLVGISLREQSIRMSEAVGHSGKFKIKKVAAGTSRIPFSFDAIKDRLNIQTFAQDLNKVYETAGFETNQASLAVDSDLVIIKKIPVDATLDGDELKDQIRWEVSQFMINPLDHFVIAHEVLPEDGQESSEKIVVVVVIRKAVVDFLKEIFASTDLHLRAIDVDVFAAQRLLEKAYRVPQDHKIALVDLRKRNLQLSVLYHNFYLVQEVEFPEEEALPDEIDRDEHISRVVSKELRRIILDNKLGKSVEDMNEVFLYGDGVNDRMIDILSKSHNVSFRRINPFETIPLTESPSESEIKEHPESFVTAVGAAIKGF